MSTHIGDPFTVTTCGQWGHRANTFPVICTGIQRDKEGHYEYRFTRVGDSSIPLEGLPFDDYYSNAARLADGFLAYSGWIVPRQAGR